MDRKVVLVTGGNRGIGFEICRQLSALDCMVILTARDETRGLSAVREIGKNTDFCKLDMDNPESMVEVYDFLESSYGRLDVLINNAAIMIDKKPATKEDPAIVDKTLQTNFIGPYRLIQTLLPLLGASNDARIINMSSGMGAMSDMGSGYPGYRISKTALNAMTMILASELQPEGIKVNAMCPGWVKTDMGGSGAPRPVEKGADTAVWLATSDKIPNGKFLRDRKIIDW